MFDLASEFLSSGDDTDRKALIRKKAEWAAKVSSWNAEVNPLLQINEPRAAAEMFLSAGDTMRAVAIMGENGWGD